ncbi:hypothetical protein [Caenispirillum salinarum]|uniref:hypothetical protein n=1 Tax=Caenispirillum salinarum TaxID=859058 RepID=UPI00384E1C92
MTETTPRRAVPAAIAEARAPGAVIPLHRHPVFLRRKIARDTREVLDQVAEAQASLDRIHSALTLFRTQLARSRKRLEPTRADCAATMAALDSGDVAEMERVRDAILERMEAQGRA